jgi:predicted O-methyltransferase YrrM
MNSKHVIQYPRMQALDPIERVRALAASTEGWLSDRQGRALYQAARATSGRGAIVEIGSWKGRSTVWLAAGARLAGQRVVAIDPHCHSREDPDARTLAEFQANIARAGLADWVEPMVMTSSAAAAVLTSPVELLFIDGDHTPAAVARDAALWLPRLAEGGTVMFHDVATSGYAGPRRVFRRSVCASPSFGGVRLVGSMAVARRTARRSVVDAVRAQAVSLWLVVYDLKALLRVIPWRRAPRQRPAPAERSN